MAHHFKTTYSILNRNLSSIKFFFIVFYAVGITGLLLPLTFPLFLKLIPLAILLSFTALLLTHKNFTQREVSVFLFIYITGFLVEVIGVNTALIFGPYHYGESLGPALLNTPLIIGLNWLLLVYVTASITVNLGIPAAGKVFAGATLMLGYDVVIEQVAPSLDMWHWHTGSIPLQNYMAWFIIAAIFHGLIQLFKIKLTNKLGPFMFVCLAVFFILLFIFLN
jgi:bisanhydrobacterioruberin hydratase